MLKQLGLSISIFFTLSLTAIVAQNYVPFDLGDSEWQVTEVSFGGSTEIPQKVTKYFTFGETIVNGIKYSNLYCQDLCSYLYPQPGSKEIVTVNDTTYFMMGGLREEDKKLFYYHMNDTAYWSYGGLNWLEKNTEYLLYDFGASLGDTVFHGDGNYTVIVDELTPVSGRRRYEAINSTGRLGGPKTKLVEGIGSENGLFAGLSVHNNWLTCFRVKGSRVWKWSCSCCPDPRNFVDVSRINNFHELILGPNPTSGIIRIESLADPIENIEVYSSQGKLLQRIEIGSNSIELNLQTLPKGMYFFYIFSSSGKIGLREVVKH